MGSPATQQLPRRLTAVMFTDVVGYTAMMQEDEEAARVVRLLHGEALEAAIAAHGGELVQYLGDGSLSTFPSAVRAVSAGIEVQRALRDSVPLRVGVHEGEVAFDDQGIYGDSVNVASRVMGLGIAGSVLVSDKVNDELKNQKNLSTTSLGQFPLKNVKHPPTIYAINSEGIALPTREDLFPASEATTRYEKPPPVDPKERPPKAPGSSVSRLRRVTVAVAATLALGASAWGVYTAFAVQPETPPPLSLAENAEEPLSGSGQELESSPGDDLPVDVPVSGDDRPVDEPLPVAGNSERTANDTRGNPDAQAGGRSVVNAPETAGPGAAEQEGTTAPAVPGDLAAAGAQAALDGDRLSEIQNEFDSYVLRDERVPDAVAEAAASAAALVFERNADRPLLLAQAAFVHAQALGYVDDWRGAVSWAERAVDLAPRNEEYRLVLESARGNL